MQRPWLAHYPEGMPAEIALDGYGSLVELLDEACRRHASRVLCTFMGKSLTYAQIDGHARAFAAWLQSLGLPQGSRVALMMPNVPAYLACMLGAWRAGCVLVNINPLFTPRELQHQLRDSEPEVIVILENFAHTLEQVAEGRPRHVAVATLGDLPGGLGGWVVNMAVRHVKRMVPAWHLPGAKRLARILREGAGLPYAPQPLSRDHLAVLQYTGGTTGRPKGACLTHGNLIANVLQMDAVADPALGPVKHQPLTMLTALPLYHIFALTVCALYGMHAGMRLVLVINPRDLPALVETWRKAPPSIFPGVNTLYNALVHHPAFAGLDFSDLRLALGGGMAVQRVTAEAWAKLTGRPIIEGYGLSETSPVVTANPTDSTEYSGSIGLPVPSTDVAILDEEGRHLPIGERGELGVRGPQVMQGYWRRPEDTRAVMTEDGFFRTGDIAVMDERGYIRIVDRKKDMILVSGFNVYPSEIEQAVSEHPGVLECAAVGVPDERTGEAVRLYVVKEDPALTEEALLAWLKERLTGYKRPRHVAFRSELPKSNVGKILRRELRDEALAGNGGQA